VREKKVAVKNQCAGLVMWVTDPIRGATRGRYCTARNSRPKKVTTFEKKERIAFDRGMFHYTLWEPNSEGEKPSDYREGVVRGWYEKGCGHCEGASLEKGCRFISRVLRTLHAWPWLSLVRKGPSYYHRGGVVRSPRKKCRLISSESLLRYQCKEAGSAV